MPIMVGAMMRRLTRPDLPRIEVYGDESMKRGQYDLLGGLWIRAGDAAGFRAEIADIRATSPGPGQMDEIKWTKCSGNAEKPVIASVVDRTMERIRDGTLEFKCLVVDRSLVDNRAWNDGDRELGFYKAWSILLFSKMRAGYVYRIKLDARQLQNQSRLEDLRDVLNAKGYRDLGLDYPCCGSLEGADSKKDDMVQIADLLTGAVGYHYCGGHDAPGASPGKILTAERIARHLSRPSLCYEASSSEQRFNVWKWRPRRR